MSVTVASLVEFINPPGPELRYGFRSRDKYTAAGIVYRMIWSPGWSLSRLRKTSPNNHHVLPSTTFSILTRISRVNVLANTFFQLLPAITLYNGPVMDRNGRNIDLNSLLGSWRGHRADWPVMDQRAKVLRDLGLVELGHPLPQREECVLPAGLLR